MCGEVGIKQNLGAEVRPSNPGSTQGAGPGALQTLLAPSLRSFSNCEVATLILHYHLFLSDMLR